jgi:hypothetical protein
VPSLATMIVDLSTLFAAHRVQTNLIQARTRGVFAFVTSLEMLLRVIRPRQFRPMPPWSLRFVWMLDEQMALGLGGNFTELQELLDGMKDMTADQVQIRIDTSVCNHRKIACSSLLVTTFSSTV